jgi:hypothetical protein
MSLRLEHSKNLVPSTFSPKVHPAFELITSGGSQLASNASPVFCGMGP